MQSYKSIWQNYTKSKNELTIEEYEKLQLEIAFLKKQLSSQAKLIKLLKDETYHDNLTKLWNRKKFDEDLEKAIAFFNRYQKESAILFIDLNDFKSINDTLGHLCGDNALQHLAKILKTHSRINDEVYRLGGDEFVIIMSEILAENAQAKANELSNIIKNSAFMFNNKEIKLSASIGLATINSITNKNAIISQADKNMYQMKQQRQESYLAS